MRVYDISGNIQQGGADREPGVQGGAQPADADRAHLTGTHRGYVSAWGRK